MAESELPKRRLEGKVAIITGGASGIGEATARLFVKHGTRVVVIADVQDEKGNAVAESIGLDLCRYVHCDVTDERQVESLVKSTVKSFGKLDVMFSNAGVDSAGDQTVLDLDLDAGDRLFAVNVRGMAACVKHAARSMVETGLKGSIVCTASCMARIGYKLMTDYVMSKHATLGLVRCASLQLGKHGIRVNCVSPGALATTMTCQRFGSPAEVEKMFDSSSWLDGVLKVKHVADAVLFLASDDSEFINGHDLSVDGGCCLL